MIEPNDDNNFNAIRLLCAFAILVSHFFPLRDGDENYEPFMRLSGHLCNIGKIVTYVTFVISGLLVTRSYLRHPHLIRYLRHRALRILPALWGVVAFCILAIGLPLTGLPLKTFLHNSETIKFIANIVLYPNHYGLPGVFTEFPLADFRTAVNGSLWVIPPLVLMYLLIPALGAMKLLRPAVLLAIALFSLAAWELYQLHGISEHSRLFKYKIWIDFIPHLGFFFFCGAAVASFNRKLSLNLGLFLLTIALSAVCLRTRAGYLVLSLAIPYVTLYLGSLSAPVFRPLNRAGVIAFGVYLYGWPAQQLVMRVWCRNASGVTQVMISCLLAGALGTLSWLLIERTALRVGSGTRTD